MKTTAPSHTTKTSTDGPYTSDLRKYLQNELEARCARNPKYSLRSFAKSLGIEPSALSKILNNKRRISFRMFSQIVDKLGLGPEEVAKLNPPKLNSQRSVDENVNQLGLDSFKIISDWYHFAILELIHVKPFVGDPKWIAKVLGITVSEVNFAVERMQRLELLEIDDSGKWHDRAGTMIISRDGFTDAARKRLQRQVLEKSLEALDLVEKKDREHTTMTMSINPDHMAEAKEKINKFKHEMCRFMQTGHRKEVYNLHVSLYPLSDVENKIGDKK